MLIAEKRYLTLSFGLLCQQDFCSFVHEISTELRAWRHFLLLLEFLFYRAIEFGHTWLTSRPKVTSSLRIWLFFTFILGIRSREFLFRSISFNYVFETADLRSYCGYFLAICQLCFKCWDINIENFLLSVIRPSECLQFGPKFSFFQFNFKTVVCLMLFGVFWSCSGNRGNFYFRERFSPNINSLGCFFHLSF